jgi:PAS domain S-box-containing protein
MLDKLSVLLAEDSPSDAKLIVAALQGVAPVIEFERVQTAEGLRAALSVRAWDAVISDWSMPGFSATAALALVQELGLDLPFIIVSGTIGEEAAVEAMHRGAHDCVLKHNLSRLGPAIEREIRDCRARVEHRRGEVRRRAMLETALDAIVGMDESGCITEFNPAAEQHFRYARADVLGKPLADFLIPQATRAAHRDGLERYLACGEGAFLGRRVEVEAMRSDGAEFPIELAITRIGAESPAGFVGFIRDLSERKRAEEALRRSEEQLRHASKMEAVGRLAGGVAHDFNNILSVILGYAELILEDQAADSALRSDLDAIRDAATRGAGLTRQLLTFSRQRVFEVRILDLKQVLESVETMLQRIVGEDIELVMLVEGATARVRADATHIEQIVLNLVVNARDAMPQGGKLTIEVADVVLDGEYAASHLSARPGAYAMIAVTDTGVGMDRDTQSRIFEPFFTTKPLGKGTGLGLATVFGIVQQSGGSIFVYSEPGHGTSFKIYLPSVAAPADVVRPTEVATALAGHETILVVEDQIEVRTIMANILVRQGYRVLVAETPEEALSIAAREGQKLDLLLTDVVMPHMSGPELANKLLERLPELKVLCTSGYTDDAVLRHGLLDASVAFLQKPITPTSLGRKVREVLDVGTPPSRSSSALSREHDRN